MTCLMALVLMSACSQQKVEVSKEKKKETPDWIIQYRDYLKKAKKDPGHRLYEKDAKVGIANIYDDETPTLFVITDEEQERDLVYIFYQYEDENVSEKASYYYYSSSENEGCEYVYDKLDKKYEWYIKQSVYPGSDIYTYTPIDFSYDKFEPLYVWEEGADRSNEMDAIDFEDRFISTGITLNSYDRFDFTEDMTDASFEKSMMKLEEDYETVMETIPEDVEQKAETEEETVATPTQEATTPEQTTEVVNNANGVEYYRMNYKMNIRSEASTDAPSVGWAIEDFRVLVQEKVTASDGSVWAKLSTGYMCIRDANYEYLTLLTAPRDNFPNPLDYPDTQTYHETVCPAAGLGGRIGPNLFEGNVNFIMGCNDENGDASIIY